MSARAAGSSRVRRWITWFAALGPLAFVALCVTAVTLDVALPRDPVGRISASLGVALLVGLLGGELLTRRQQPPVLAHLVAGLWLASLPRSAAEAEVVASLWPIVTTAGAATLGLLFGFRSSGGSAAGLRRALAAGGVIALCGFAASALAALVLGKVFGYGPAQDAALDVRLMSAFEAGLSTSSVHPWFVGGVLVLGLRTRSLERLVCLATASAVAVALVLAMLLGSDGVSSALWWTVPSALLTVLATVLVRRRAPRLRGFLLIAGLVAAVMLAPYEPMSVFLVFFAAGWADATLRDRTEDDGASPAGGETRGRDVRVTRALLLSTLGYFVLLGSARSLPGDVETGVAAAGLVLARLGLVVLVARTLFLRWNVAPSDARRLEAVLAVGGGAEALGWLTPWQGTGTLLVEETAMLAAGLLLWATTRRGEKRSVAALPRPERARLTVRDVVRRRSFHDRWLSSRVGGAASALVERHGRLESELSDLATRLGDQARVLGDVLATFAAEGGRGGAVGEALQRVRTWVESAAGAAGATSESTQPGSAADAAAEAGATSQRAHVLVSFSTYVRDVARMVEPRLVLEVPLEDAFLLAAPSDGLTRRAVKMVRRARQRAVGRSERTVHVGRLWRAHVVVALPIVVEPALRAYLEALAEAELRLVQLTIDAVRGRAGFEGASAVSAPETVAAELESIAEQLETARRLVVHRLALGVAEVNREFVRMVARAGTLEALSVRRASRPNAAESRRARRAIAQLLRTWAVGSQRRWQRVELELVLARVGLWFDDFRRRVLDDIERTGRLGTHLGDAESVRVVLGERIGDCARHVPGTSAIRRLERRISALPEELVVSGGLRMRRQLAGAQDSDVLRVDVRRFVQSETAREAALAVVDATRELKQLLRRTRSAVTGGEGLEAAFAEHERDLAALREAFDQRLSAIRGRLGEVTSLRVILRSRAAAELHRSALARGLSPLVRWVREDAIPTLGALTRDLRDELRHRTREEQREALLAYQERLARRVPEHYRRFFDPGLADVADFYVERPEIEAQLVTALAARSGSRLPSVLVHGLRGSGKTAVVQHALPRLGAQVLLEIGVRRDEPLESALASALGAPSASLAAVEAALLATSAQHVIVLDEFETAFRRTPEGLQSLMAFVDLMARTREHASWVVVIRTPTARFLDAALGFFDFFEAVVEVQPLDRARAERLLQQRHRVSGYELEVQRAPLQTLRGLSQRIVPWRRRREHTLFDTLNRRARGNPELLQQLWLAAASVAVEERRVILRDEPIPDFDLHDVLSDEQRAVAATLVLHRALDASEVAAILCRPIELTLRNLEYLERVGLAITSGHRYELNPLFALRIIRQLQQEHRL